MEIYFTVNKISLGRSRERGRKRKREGDKKGKEKKRDIKNNRKMKIYFNVSISLERQ